MSQFYNRYVPPRKHRTEAEAVTQGDLGDNSSHDYNEPSRQNKKRKASQATDNTPANVSSNTRPNNSELKVDAPTGESVLNKYSISQFAKSHAGQDVIKPRKQPQVKVKLIGEDDADKYITVLNKYNKSKTRSAPREDRDNGNSILKEPPVLEEQRHGLVPIPQPESPEIVAKDPTFSVLPMWQATPTHVTPSEGVALRSLGLGGTILSNLQAGGIEKAFPVQSTVIPMLTKGERHYEGDVCISAATGSGKTLAYVVPIVEDLIRDKGSGLHAVIVVPTRELVTQVRQTCQMCAAGLNLNIVTTLGSKSLKEEEKALVIEEEIYDPEAYKRELQTPMQWADFSLESLLQRARHRDSAKAVDYVTRKRIIPDILVTTPGRLVDHLQNTVGFHLDDVRWLVIDEADRLLNESYQEWIDTVVPALRSRRATRAQDQIFAYMRMELPPRIVSKILLSATMTRDISKLNAIGLNNPKLVVLQSSQDVQHGLARETSQEAPISKVDAAEGYLLPTSLQELAVTFKEGSEKPLLLVQILQNHINISYTNKSRTKLSHKSEDPTSSDSEDSDSVTDSSTDSTDSDGETISDSLSNSSSESSNSTRSNRLRAPSRESEDIIAAESATRVLIFTRSTASASRLSRLLCIVSPALAPRIATLTRNTASSSASRKALSSFRTGKTPILVATDRASRGLDIVGLQHVISYDIPGSVLTYVHRVGRTARAGRKGSAWTMVEHREGKWFWNEIGGKSPKCMIRRSTKVKRIGIDIADDDNLRKKYEEALHILEAEVKGQ